MPVQLDIVTHLAMFHICPVIDEYRNCSGNFKNKEDPKPCETCMEISEGIVEEYIY